MLAPHGFSVAVPVYRLGSLLAPFSDPIGDDTPELRIHSLPAQIVKRTFTSTVLLLGTQSEK